MSGREDRDLLEADFPVLSVASTRWSDNDVYGHMNNAVHYQLFDSAINGWIASQAPDVVSAGDVIGVVAESGCTYYSELSFPDDVLVGLRVERLGRTSVTYELGLFARPQNSAQTEGRAIAAKGRWVHVYVDAQTRRPAPIQGQLRTLLESAQT
ncbi:acyl-CoA thioesterase [Lapillicoccus sp.]|uniref:acyl-CoA thioesterase n=1 Tax=Lapillicoccus sp. TaxID=1909287 RepID=UPI003982FF66